MSCLQVELELCRIVFKPVVIMISATDIIRSQRFSLESYVGPLHAKDKYQNGEIDDQADAAFCIEHLNFSIPLQAEDYGRKPD